jgi:DNA-binding response OmpR family regulator
MHILVVDDEYLIRYALSAVFKDDRTEVTTTADGAETLDALRRNTFGLCFLDIHLPDMNGLDLMQKIRAASPSTLIVIMTGSEVTLPMMMTIREHAQAVITKPFDLYEAKRFVHQMLLPDRPLQREERKGLKDYASFLRWFINDDRKQERKPVGRSITCSPISAGGNGGGGHSADVLDISDTGMRIRTECCFDPGHVLLFGNSKERIAGVVRWNARDSRRNAYCAGVQFVDAGDAPSAAPR